MKTEQDLEGGSLHRCGLRSAQCHPQRWHSAGMLSAPGCGRECHNPLLASDPSPPWKRMGQDKDLLSRDEPDICGKLYVRSYVNDRKSMIMIKQWRNENARQIIRCITKTRHVLWKLKKKKSLQRTAHFSQSTVHSFIILSLKSTQVIQSPSPPANNMWCFAAASCLEDFTWGASEQGRCHHFLKQGLCVWVSTP